MLTILDRDTLQLDGKIVVRVLVACVLWWAVLVFVCAAIYQLEAVRLDTEAGFAELVRHQVLGTLPWLVLYPAIGILTYSHGVLRTPLRDRLADAFTLSLAGGCLIYFSWLFVYEPLQAASALDVGVLGIDDLVRSLAMAGLVVIVTSGQVSRVRKTETRGPSQIGAGPDVFSDLGGGRLIARSAGVSEIVDVRDVFAVSAQGNYMLLVMPDREVLHRATLSELMPQLLKRGFIHVHRSHLIRADQIISATRSGGRVTNVRVKSGHSFPVSARGAVDVERYLDSAVDRQIPLAANQSRA